MKLYRTISSSYVTKARLERHFRFRIRLLYRIGAGYLLSSSSSDPAAEAYVRIVCTCNRTGLEFLAYLMSRAPVSIVAAAAPAAAPAAAAAASVVMLLPMLQLSPLLPAATIVAAHVLVVVEDAP